MQPRTPVGATRGYFRGLSSESDHDNVDYLEQNDHHYLPLADPEHLYNDNRQVGFPVPVFFRESQTGEVAEPFSFHGSIRRPSQVTRVRFSNTLDSVNWET